MGRLGLHVLRSLVLMIAFAWPDARGQPAPPGVAPKLEVPSRELPAQGSCRVWQRGRPASDQAPVGACSEAWRRAPPGTWILDRTERQRVRVFVLDDDVKGKVDRIYVYDAERGGFLRELPV